MDHPDIQMLLIDVDGVLTDGGVFLDARGGEMKRFDIRDGMGMVVWRKCGLKLGIISGRPSEVTSRRAAELGIDYVEQCQAMDKAASLENICGESGIDPRNIAYVGNDLADLPVMRRVSYPIAVADAAPEVVSAAKYVTKSRGGYGAVREVIEHLLKAMDRWDEVLDDYGA